MSESGVRQELASHRKLRDRNKPAYRLAHWPIWIAVFYLVPGPYTVRMFSRGWDPAMALWLATVLLGTGLAAVYGKLPGVEPKPYIIRFTEDKPNPLYRRICYTVAWSELLAYALLNLAGLAIACLTGKWRMTQIYSGGYFPIAAAVWILGMAGALPRVKSSTQGEGVERRYFYGMVWAVPIAQGVLWLLWQTLPVNAATNWIKLGAFVTVLGITGVLASRGLLPRTRRIVPGELAISD